MKKLICRSKASTGLFVFFVCLAVAGCLFPPSVWGQGKLGKEMRKTKAGKKSREVLDRAKAARLRRRPDAPAISKRQAAAAIDSASPLDRPRDASTAFSFTENPVTERFIQTFDKPREAVAHFLRKRLPEGEKILPVEKYLEAREQMRGMEHFSTALDRATTGVEQLAAPLNEQANAATWSPLGPGNIGGRTRAILIHPTDPNIIYAAGVSGGVWKTTNGGQAWTPLGDAMATLAISAMAFEPGNPNTIYAGTGEGVIVSEVDTIGDFRGAGIFKTTDAGATWTRLAGTSGEDFHYVNDIVISAGDKNRVYAATRTGVWRSTDAGAAWQRTLQPLNDDGDDITGGVFDLAIRTDKTDADVLFASCGSFEQATVYRNKNAEAAGTTGWEAVLTEGGMGRTSLAIAPSNQNIVYALASSIEFGDPYELGLLAVFRSTSGGDKDTWTAQVRNTDQNKLNTLLLSNPYVATLSVCQVFYDEEVFSQGWYDNVIAVDPLDPNRVWAGGIDLFRSDDGGKNWGVASYWWVDDPGGPKGIPQYAHADQHAIVFHPQYDGANNQIMFVGGDGGIFRTNNARAAVATGRTATCQPSNGAVTWRSLNNGYGVTQFYHGAVSPDGKSYFGGTQDNGTLLGTDDRGVNNWREINGGDGGYVAFDSRTPATMFASTPGISFVKSTDGGASFGTATYGINDSGQFVTPLAIDPSDPNRLWTGGDYIWRTTSGGALWTFASAITAGTSQVSAIAVSPNDSNRMLVGMPDGYIHRQDAALTSTRTTAWPVVRPRTGWVSSLAFDPNSKDIAYATYSTFGGTHVWRTTNGGQAWSGIDGTGMGRLPDVPAHSIAIDPSNTARLYVATDVGVFVSTNGGMSWAVEDTGFPNVITETLVMHVASGVTQLYAFTHGRGAWRVAVNNSGCNYALSPATVKVDTAASTGTVNVTAQPGGCNWTSASNASWLRVTGSGSANGTAGFSVDANMTFSERTATATIAGRSFTVTQPGQLDTLSPEIAITDPQVAPTVVNTSGLINLGGTAKDNNAVAAVAWATDRGATGAATFSSAQGRWAAANIPLGQGMNTITMTARDAAGNLASATMRVASTPEWTLTTVVGTGVNGTTGDGGQAAAARLSRAIRLAFDGAGNLYFTDSDNNTIRKVTPAGIVSVIAGQPGQRDFTGDGGPATAAKLSFPIAIVFDGAGNLYFNDNGNVRIRKITASTGVISTIAGNGMTGFSGDNGPATEARLNAPQGIAVDKDGNVYIADAGNNRVRKVNATDGKISTIAGTGIAGNTGDNGPATEAQLNQPLDVAIDKDGNAIICDGGNHRIRRLTVADGKIGALAGAGPSSGFSGDSGPALEARLNSPVGAIYDAAGNLFFSDRFNQRIRRVAAGTNIITTIAGNGEQGFNGDGLNATGSRLFFPSGLALDPAGSLYIGDRDNRRIRKLIPRSLNDAAPPTIAITSPTTAGTLTTSNGAINLSGTAADNVVVAFVRWSNDRGGSGLALGTTAWSVPVVPLQTGLNKLTVTAWDASGNAASAALAIDFNPPQFIANFAGEGGPGDTGDGGPATGARLSPIGLAFANGTLFVADDESHRVRRINAAGIISPFAGTGALGSSGDGGPALNASMNRPNDLVVDAAGNVYIADTENHRVRRVAPDGRITTYAGTGVPDYNGDNIPATQAQLAGPTGLALDAAGNLYIADSDNRRVRKVTASTGIITTVAGNGLVGFGGDGGPATQAQFQLPFGLAIDRNGVLYVLDRVDHRIRRVAPDGTITTIAGTGDDGYNGDDKPAREAQINFGAFMTTDADGNLYFADLGNHRVRKITISTGMISTVVGTGVSGSGGNGGDPRLAQISLPYDVAFDGAGNIYVADWGNWRIRKVQANMGLRTLSSVSAASFMGDSVAPESIVAAMGMNLAPSMQVANALPLPTTLNGTTVRVRDAAGVERLAPLFFVGPTQVNFQVPLSTAVGTATVTITSGDGSTSTGLLPVTSVAPGVFAANMNGQGVLAGVTLRIKADGSQIYETVARLDAATNRFVSTPIDLGPESDQVFLIFFGTGWRFRSAEANVKVSIGGVDAPVLYAGSAPGLIGADQINVRLPRTLAGKGEVDLIVIVDGKAASAVKINLK
jgi:uncharacterized protein (TIGR03437 family)